MSNKVGSKTTLTKLKISYIIAFSQRINKFEPEINEKFKYVAP